MISAKLIASSTPGIAKARSCIMLPIIPLESAVVNSIGMRFSTDHVNIHCSTISWMALVGSISIA